MIDNLTKALLKEISNLHKIPNGAVSFRKNGKSDVVQSSQNIIIEKKEYLSGINVYIKSSCKNEACHIPVVITENGIYDVVYNDFYIEDGAKVTIVAGCGIHSDGESYHNGVHKFHIGKNAEVLYLENHIATGDGKKQELSPVTVMEIGENSVVTMNTTQLGGVTYSNRKTKAVVKENAILNVNEKILTSGFEIAKTDFEIKLKGKNSRGNIVSRSVAKNESEQVFKSNLIGNDLCFGRVECDAIVLNRAVVVSQPKVTAKSELASLSHEATIGRIAKDQLIKLMSLGLTEEEATNKIIEGFLK
jgi:Fe-S cluster assembly scaffold protein SufB